MSEENVKNVTGEITEPASAPAEKVRSPYAVFMWGGLIMAAACVFLAIERLGIKRPARADAYFITGILGVLSAAMAWSLGKAHERSLRSQQTLKDSVDRLQDSMQDMPRSLMEESVRVAEREAAGRRADQERQARELREALEGGITAGFKPLAPALSERIEASLSGLADSLRSDREERSKGLREMSDTLGSLRTAQGEWATASASLLEKLREQGSVLHKDLSERDASAARLWPKLRLRPRNAFRRWPICSWRRCANSPTHSPATGTPLRSASSPKAKRPPERSRPLRALRWTRH